MEETSLALPGALVPVFMELAAECSGPAGRLSLGCRASSRGVSSTMPRPLMLLTSGRSLGALRLELAQPTIWSPRMLA